MMHPHSYNCGFREPEYVFSSWDILMDINNFSIISVYFRNVINRLSPFKRRTILNANHFIKGNQRTYMSKI